MNWCAVIPAAGQGSRLGEDRPKLLVEVVPGRTVWSYLRERLEPVVDQLCVVLSPAGRQVFPGGAAVAIQEKPTGMGDAVFCAQPRCRHILVVWGDQLGVSAETLRRTVEAHRGGLTLPLVRVQRPYVQYDLDDAGRLVGVRESREGDTLDDEGWGDVGTFALSTEGLADAWGRFEGKGRRTGERNFLPFLVFLAQQGWETRTLFVADPAEARGLNTPEDLEFFRGRLNRPAAPGSPAGS